jgi:hypothetical protein
MFVEGYEVQVYIVKCFDKKLRWWCNETTFETEEAALSYVEKVKNEFNCIVLQVRKMIIGD